MKTADYQWHQCEFAEFNKVQKSVIPYVDQDVNIVVSFGTATGKTAIAECAAGYHLQNGDNHKFVYCSPLKSLSMEKYNKWKSESQYKKYGISIYTGDKRDDRKSIERNRILVFTTEALNSKTRNASCNDWLEDVACLVVDESHIIGQKRRGAAVEGLLMRYTDLNPDGRVILLSATMTNHLQLASWLKSLNGKPTKAFFSVWSPYHKEYDYHYYPNGYRWYENEQRKIDNVCDVVYTNYVDEKIIVFVHSKKTGKSIVDRLSSMGIKCAFHNASLSASKRAKIEKMFNDDVSGMNVLVSTSTLASGINIG